MGSPAASRTTSTAMSSMSTSGIAMATTLLPSLQTDTVSCPRTMATQQGHLANDLCSAYPGPNGDAVVHCGEGKSTSCSFANCDKSSINIESQESVVCGEYL